MEPRWSLAPQEVPHDLAVHLRRLRDADRGATLNALLAAAHEREWRAPSLARALDMNPPAVSKRIERGRRAARNQEPGWQTIAAEIAVIEIPDAPPARTVAGGRELPQAKIDELLALQAVAEKVNGAMPADAKERRDSERLSAELHRLVSEEDIRPAYLARALGRSHRAIISRLERHHFREPCPSVAGTASGQYFGRKIGDPGQGAPRLTREERAELRALWEGSRDGRSARERRSARGKLATRLRRYLREGFTLANLSQAMSTKDVKVNVGSLAALLAASQKKEKAEVGT